jgi:hypothetical protein
MTIRKGKPLIVEIDGRKLDDSSSLFTDVYCNQTGFGSLWSVRLCTGEKCPEDWEDPSPFAGDHRKIVANFRYNKDSSTKVVYIINEKNISADAAIVEIRSLPKWIWELQHDELKTVIAGSMPWATDYDKANLMVYMYSRYAHSRKDIPSKLLPDTLEEAEQSVW